MKGLSDLAFVLIMLLVFLLLLSLIHCSDDLFGNQFHKICKSRAIAWNQLKGHVSINNFEKFKKDLNTFKEKGLLQDEDSGYFELLHYCLSHRPRDSSHQFLQVLLRSVCTKNIVQLLPDLIDYFDLEGFLILRKYCPVGRGQINNVLEILPQSQESNPLSRYLLNNWESPDALEFTKSRYAMEEIFTEGRNILARSGIRRFNDEGLMEENHQFIDRVNSETFTLQYHNLIFYSTGLGRDSIAEIIPELLKAVHNGAKGELRRLECWINMFPGSFSMALLKDGRVHLWRKGEGTFVIISLSTDEGQSDDGYEEVRYPLGDGFKVIPNTLKYTSVAIRLNSLLIYVSNSITKRIHLHDLLGVTLYFSDDQSTLKENFRHLLDNLGDTDEDAIFRAYHILDNPLREREVPPAHRIMIRPRSFRIFSNTEDQVSSIPFESRISRDTDFNFRLESTWQNPSDPWSLFLDSEASYDENDELASSDGGEETLFTRRRWWFDNEQSHLPSESGGYDSSMSRDFFYRREHQSSFRTSGLFNDMMYE